MAGKNKKINTAGTNSEEKYDRITIRVSKGRKVVLQIHAAKQGESLSAFCNRAIDSQMLRDN